MRIGYVVVKNWRPETRMLLDRIVAIVDDYESQGYRLTLRQLYYQLVATDVIPNLQREYARLSRILTEARMAGLISWDIIEDRVRVPQMPGQWDDIPDLVDTAIKSYRRDRWAGQDNYVEVWVEKDAISGVLLPITREFHCRLMVNRGYSSCSAMHDAALRIKKEQNIKRCFILYLGDHDPSGEDMVRDVYDRLTVFGCEVEVNKIALTMNQINKYKPTPNPAKLSDSRSANYVAEHGNYSWEVDALRPDVLHKLVTREIVKLLDSDKYESIVALEIIEKDKLRKLAKKIN